MPILKSTVQRLSCLRSKAVLPTFGPYSHLWAHSIAHPQEGARCLGLGLPRCPPGCPALGWGGGTCPGCPATPLTLMLSDPRKLPAPAPNPSSWSLQLLSRYTKVCELTAFKNFKIRDRIVITENSYQLKYLRGIVT